MGLNLDHVLRGAAEHGGRVRQTHPDYSDFFLHICVAEKWHLSSYFPCSLNIEALIQAFFSWSDTPTCTEFCTPGLPKEFSLGLQHLWYKVEKANPALPLSQARHAESSSFCGWCSGKAT